MQPWHYIVIALAVVALIVLGFALVRSRRRGISDSTTPPVTQPSDVPTAPPEEATSQVSEADEPSAVDVEPRDVTEPSEAQEPEAAEEPAPVDLPEISATRWQRLRERLARSGAIGNAILSVFSRGSLAESDWEEIEETLLMADLGLDPTEELMTKLRRDVAVIDTSDPAEVRRVLHRHLVSLVNPTLDRSLDLRRGEDGEPAGVLVVGVNGTGKTTTVGKLARMLVADGNSVVLGAADTFRAAAGEQLQTWGDRVGVPVVRSEKEGADPASVAFEAVKEGAAQGSDIVIVDTAGRLQTKADLMDELGKIKRVMAKGAPVREVLLVLDATTGQNGLRQAQVFSEAVEVTGIVLTKLDGTAKGGIVVAVQRELGVPVKFVGLGEGPDDLAPFDSEGFVTALLS